MRINSPNYYNSQIFFKSIDKPNFKANSDRAQFHPDTVKVLDNVYTNYKKSLNEVTFSEIRKTALKVSSETQIPKKDVVKAMQLLTQFSNIKSLMTISKALQKENIKYLGNQNFELAYKSIDKGLSTPNVRRISEETGIHNSLTYVLEKKKLAPFSSENNEKIGLILDDDKIAQLEQVKKSQPEQFNNLVKDKNLKFFYISGWDTGIPVINRTQNLEDKTVELLNRAKKYNVPLEKAIDYPKLDRIKSLGIKPIVIKNENEPNELAVYNQMKPEQLATKNSLYNIVEANILSRASNKNDATKSKINHISAKYLEDTLCVYTPEKMSKDLKLLHKKINDYANEQNREVVYLLPDKGIKSNDYLNYSYRKINNIDSSKFVNIKNLVSYHSSNPERNKDNTLYVVLDDCALSGNSMLSILNYGLISTEKTPILFANLKCSDEAIANFMRNSSRSAKVMYVDKINPKNIGSEKLEDIIGESSYHEEAYSIAFPYMAPDNNCELGSNIALLHNPKYNLINRSSERNRKHYSNYELNLLDRDTRKDFEKAQKKNRDFCSSSKTLSDNVLKVSAQYSKMIGKNYQTLPESDLRYLTSNDLNEAVEELLPN